MIQHQDQNFLCEQHPAYSYKAIYYGEICPHKRRLLCLECIIKTKHRDNIASFLEFFQDPIGVLDKNSQYLKFNNDNVNANIITIIQIIDSIETQLNKLHQNFTEQLRTLKQQYQSISNQNKEQLAEKIKLKEFYQQLDLVCNMDTYQGTEEFNVLEKQLNEIIINWKTVSQEYSKQTTNNQQMIQQLTIKLIDYRNQFTQQWQLIFDKQQIPFKQAKLEIQKKYQHFISELENDRDSLKICLQEKEDDYNYLQVQFENLKQENDNLIQQFSFSNESKLFKEQDQIISIQQRKQSNNEYKLEEEKQLPYIDYLEKQKGDCNIQKILAQRQKNGQLLINKAICQRGEIELCFVVDVTCSTEPYKKLTEDCILGIGEIIKDTGRNTRLSTIAYQDIDEWRKNKNQYFQHDFADDFLKIYDFLRSIKCAGGDDYCEDVKGGLDQMMTNLTWKTNFRVAVLISDAPAHGENVNMGCGDHYPKDDISNVINKMIDQDIIFIIPQFVNWTEKMIQHIKNLYTAKGKSELFLTIELQTMKVEETWKSLIDIIVSVFTTGVKNSDTKIKGEIKTRLRTKYGAIEALFKEKNFMKFDQKAEICLESDFQVFRIYLKEQVFEEKIQTIYSINKADFQIIGEGKWKCIRTIQPYAFGMSKSVYLMKNKNDLENYIYVIKMPLEGFYETLDQVKEECRTHLICQQLMRKFMNILREKHQQKHKPHNQFPQIQYSEILILQENERKFWIAERFLDGEFNKYNNNWGFIDDNLTPINQLAQAFTYFTYIISNYQYMINDLQGVGVYFTDPAVNTSSGDYSNTDLGIDGQNMYLVNFEQKKHISRDILEVMEILID